jgi:hypothetical protein
MGDVEFTKLLISGGFTALAAFLVWRLVRTSDEDRAAARERETRMVQRLEVMDDRHTQLTERALRVQETTSNVLDQWQRTRPCLRDADARTRLADKSAAAGS